MAATTAHSSLSSSSVWSATERALHSNGGLRLAEDDDESGGAATAMNPFLLKLEQKPKAVLSHDVGAGAPCLACDACADGLDLHFWRKICKNCSCRADEHDHDFVDQPDHGEFVIRKLFDTLPPNHFARYQRPSVDDNYGNRLVASGMAPIGGGLFRRGGGGNDGEVGGTNSSGTQTTISTESILAPSPAAAAEHCVSGEYNEIAERLRKMHAARRNREQQQNRGQRSTNNASEEHPTHVAPPPPPAGSPPPLSASDTQSVFSMPHHRSTASLAALSDITEAGKPKLNAVITYKKMSPSGSTLLSTKSPTSSVQNLAKAEHVMPNGHGQNVNTSVERGATAATDSAAEDSSLNYAALREKFASMSTAVNSKAVVPPPRPPAPLRTLRITTTSPPTARRAPPMPTEPKRRRSPHGTALSDASGLTLGDETTGGKTDAYTWLPAGEPQLVGRYMRALPELERPLLGSHGAQLRRQRLAHQLPFHDCDANAAKSLGDAEERDLHRRFVEHVKQNAVGIGEIVDSDEHQKRKRSSSRDRRKSSSPGTSFLPMSGGGGGRVKENGATTAMRCRKCAEPLKWGDVGIVAPSHGASNDIWHPACFRCDRCNQLLADLLYFYDKDGGGEQPLASGTAKDVDGTPANVTLAAATGPQFLCGRHYGERVYPRCNGCDELIFAKEYTFAEDASWHVDHFCCFGCDRHLGGHRYVTKQDRPYCIDCYMLKFARTCLVCRGKIAPFESRISLHETLHWHADPKCFRCTVCAKPLANEKFSLKDENVFCGAQCSRLFRERSGTNPDLLKYPNK